MVVVSLATAEPDYAKIKNLAFGTETAEHKADSAHSWDWRDVAASLFVLVVIAGGYLYFRG